MAVCDASVLVALFRPADAHHARAASWYEAALTAGEPLQGPTILPVEVAGALVRVTADKNVVARALAQIEADFDLVPLTEQRAQYAADVATTCSVRGADAVYLALARELGATLVSLDAEQVARGAAIVTTVRP